MTDTGAIGSPAHAGKTAIVVRDRSCTYGELEERSNRLANVLIGRGVEQLDRVAVMLPNGFEMLEAGIACAKAGVQIVPVNWHLKTDEVRWILADSGARAVIAHADFADQLGAALAQVDGCELILVADAGPLGYERALAASSPQRPEREGFGSPEWFFYTSGTTGRPRGVERPAPTPGAPPAITTVAAMWGLTGDDVFLQTTPLYHATGAYAFAHLFLGSTVVVLPTWDAREWLRAVERHGVTVSVVVPAHFIRLLEVAESERAAIDTSSLRLLLHAAAPCPVPVKRAAIEAFRSAVIWEFYGASEGGATRISSEEWLAHPGSVGRPWPGTELRILDADGTPLPAGATGLVYVRPPAAMARFRYHDDPDKTAAAWRDDAFTVGDMGHLDADGYLYITDRATDMVIRGGVNIYPAEIERCLHEHPAVVDCAVLGVPDDRYGESLLALVEVRDPGVGDEELRAHCLEHLADFKCPQRFEVVDDLPRDENGKVRKHILRERHLARAEAD